MEDREKKKSGRGGLYMSYDWFSMEGRLDMLGRTYVQGTFSVGW